MKKRVDMKNNLGVLCHVTSLPNDYGMGDFGKACFDFIDTLSKTPVSIWQILPLNNTNEYNCPYGSMSSLTIDPMFVDVDDLKNMGLIEQKDILPLTKIPLTDRVDYKKVKSIKAKFFDKAYKNITKEIVEKVQEFSNSRPDIYAYAYYKTLLKIHNTNDFRSTPKYLWKLSRPRAKKFAKENADSLQQILFQQYILNSQWERVTKYATEKGISIVGDLPIYCDKRSFDVFFCPEVFKLNKNFQPLATGGVPADDFACDGQNWGTCVYNWDYLKKTNFSWFINRIKILQNKYNILRLDHFLGYITPYEIVDNDFSKSKWAEGGREAIFKQIKKDCNIKNIVVEDLGIVKKECTAIKKKFHLTGMAILQFAFLSKNSPYLPKNVAKNTFYYLGTHDNNTYIGFLNSLSTEERENVKKLLGISCDITDNGEILVESVKKMMKSKSKTIILQMQDFLLQDQRQRMNFPGVAEGCWEYSVPHNFQDTFARTIHKILN